MSSGRPCRCPWAWGAVPRAAEVRDWIEQLFEPAEGGIHTEIQQPTTWVMNGFSSATCSLHAVRAAVSRLRCRTGGDLVRRGPGHKASDLLDSRRSPRSRRPVGSRRCRRRRGDRAPPLRLGSTGTAGVWPSAPELHPDREGSPSWWVPRPGRSAEPRTEQAALVDLQAGFESWIAEPVEVLDSGDQVGCYHNIGFDRRVGIARV